MSKMNTIKLTEVETFDNNYYWTIPNENALINRAVLNEAEFILPDGFVIGEAGDGNRYIYKFDDLDYPVNLETDYSKNKEGDGTAFVFILLFAIPLFFAKDNWICRNRA